MRAYIASAIIILAVLAIAVQPAAALTETAIPFVTTNCAVFTEPLSNTALTILEFNDARSFRSSFENFDLDFPVFTDGIDAGPLTGPSKVDGVNLGEGASSNILPFGLVNLAFPSIAQTADDKIACERTYYFTDTF